MSGILILSLTNACACRCVFCGLPDMPARPLLSRSLLAAALEHAPGPGGWEEVNLTGGDPLVIPPARALFAEIHARRDRFASLSVSSAGIPAASALAGLEALDDGGPLALYVSVDGAGALHDRIRRRPGAFAEVRTFLDAARRRANVRIALTCVINRLNIDHLDEFADWAASEELPVSYAVVNSSDHYIRSAPLYDDTRLSSGGAAKAIDFLGRRSRQRLDADLVRVMNGGRRELPCRLLQDGFLITPEGDISICGTSRTMLLGSVAGGDDAADGWRRAVGRRRALLASGARTTCDSCTTNCYAWRTRDALH